MHKFAPILSGFRPKRRTITMIKTIYIRKDWPENRRLIKKCIKETYDCNRDINFIYAVDAAPIEDKEWLRTMGEIVELSEGKPPRMNLLLEKTINVINDEFVWICEQDTVLFNRLEAEKLMKLLPNNVASLELFAVDEYGKATSPTIKNVESERKLVINDKIVWLVYWATYSATLFRTAALKSINWTKCRKHLHCDIDMSKQLIGSGYKLALSRQLPHKHYASLSRRQVEHKVVITQPIHSLSDFYSQTHSLIEIYPYKINRVFYINIDGSHDRKLNVERLLLQLGLNSISERVPGIIWNDEVPSWFYKGSGGESHNVNASDGIKRNSFACALAQLECFKRAKRYGGNVLILEDDVSCDSIDIFYKYVKNLPDDFDIAYLYHHPKLPTIVKCNVSDYWQKINGQAGTYAYIINCRSIDWLIRNCDPRIKRTRKNESYGGTIDRVLMNETESLKIIRTKENVIRHDWKFGSEIAKVKNAL